MLATSEALAKQPARPAAQRRSAASSRSSMPPTPRARAGDAALRETLADYMRITRRTITAFDDFVAHLRTDPHDRRARSGVLDELRQANEELFKADSKIRERIFDHATEEQEQRLEEAIPKPAYA